MVRNRPDLVSWIVFAAWLGSIPACAPRVATEDLPSSAETLAQAGKRLGQAKAPAELTEAAKKGGRVLKLLTSAERDALGRNALRFRVDRSTIVEIATIRGFEPFWLADQGFKATGETLRNEDGIAVVYRKAFPAGMIGLGVNALDRSSPSHYAVFIKGEAGDLPKIKGEGLSIVKAGPGVSPFADVSKPFVSLPPSLVGSKLVQTRHDQRADAVLASGRVWKARQPSGQKPDQVVVSFGIEPSKQLSFTWRTDPSVTASAVRIARESDPRSLQVLTGDVHAVDSVGLLNDPTILRHQVIADRLDPDSTYVYAVGDGSPAGWSDWHRIKTAPAVLRDFGFLYLGDAQCGLEKWGELLHAARKHRPDAGFLLLAGDLVDRGNERTNWDHFFLRAAGVFEEIPFMPAVGNHEYLDLGPKIYSGMFDLPRNGPAGIDPGLVYAFEYSDAFVAVLDSNLAIYDSSLAKLQAEWLDQALTRTRATWKFVTFHHPVYASHMSRENPELAASWGWVFDKHHVDMVLQGHDHAYLRTRPIRQGKPVDSPLEGTVYVVSVSGEKFYEQNRREYTQKGMTNLATYQTIDIKVKEKRLTYRSFDREGREVDSLVIEKPAEKPSLAGDSR
jgi:hypothetical protein